MDFGLAAVWGQIIFGSIGVVLLIAWAATGQKTAALRISGALSVLISISLVIYTRYII
jgi:hypothetical protein